MDITLTWDLVIVVFFAVVTAYSFLVGKHQCVKVIVATYISLVAVQGLVTLIGRFGGEYLLLEQSLGFHLEDDILSSAKLLFFMLVMILVAVRGGFLVEYGKVDWNVMNVLATGAFGLSTAALILSTLLAYVSGLPLLSGELAFSPVIAPILGQSELLRLIVEYQDVWFALPAVLLVVVGFYDQWGTDG